MPIVRKGDYGELDILLPFTAGTGRLCFAMLNVLFFFVHNLFLNGSLLYSVPSTHFYQSTRFVRERKSTK